MKLFGEFADDWERSSRNERLMVVVGFYPLAILLIGVGPFWIESIIAFVAIVTILRLIGIWPHRWELDPALALSAMTFAVACPVWLVKVFIFLELKVPDWQLFVMAGPTPYLWFAVMILLASTTLVRDVEVRR